MKRSFKLLLCLIAVAALLVSCELPTGARDTHGHSFVDANEDCVCDICNSDGKATHKHDFVDANGDKVCDICADAAHEHTYAADWSYDATHHWHAASCSHDSEKADKAAHTLNKLGVCTVCEAQVKTPDVSTIDKAIAFAKDMIDGVENGKITENNDYGTTVDYIFADGYFYTRVSGTEVWYSLDEQGNIFGVERDADGNVRRLDAYYDLLNMNNLKGYMFVSPLAEETYYYGVEDLIAGLWEFGKDDWNGDLEVSIKDKEFAFSYGYFVAGYDASLYVVEVSFSLSDEYYVEDANVSIKAYGRSYDLDISDYVYEYVTIPGATEDDEPTYAVAEGATGNVAMDYTFAQNVEEVLENEYPADEVLASDFKVVDKDGNELGSLLTIDKREVVYLYLKDILPTTAILDFVQVNATVPEINEWTDAAYVSVTTDERGEWAIRITSYTVGEHEITLDINGVIKTFTLKVNAVVPSEVIVNTYVEEELYLEYWGEYYTAYVPYEAPSSITVWAGAPVVLMGAADKADDTACIVTVNGEEIYMLGFIDVATDGGTESIDALILDTTEAGEYEIVFTSVEDETLTKTVNVTVKAIPEDSEIAETLNGKYIYTVDGVNEYEVEFAPDAVGALTGIMTVTKRIYEPGTGDYGVEYDYLLRKATYAYEYTEEGVLETLFINGYDFDEQVALDQDTDYKVEIDGIALTKETVQLLIEGTWSVEVMDWDIYEVVDTYTLTFNNDGTVVFAANGVELHFTYTIGEYDELNRCYPITIVADEDAENIGQTTSISADATVTFGQSWDGSWMLLVDAGEVDEWENSVNWQYSKPQIASKDDYTMLPELSADMPTNVFNDMYDEGTKQIELILWAGKAGTYTVYVTNWGEEEPITALDQYSFAVGNMNVVGAITYNITEAEVITITMNVPAIFDYDVHLVFTPAETDDGEEEEGGETVASSEITITTDFNKSLNQGTYTYAIDADGKITIYNGDEVADFSASYALTFVNGVLTINSDTYPKVMTKYEGEDGVLAGSWTYEMSGMGTLYDITFTAAAEEEEVDSPIAGVYNATDYFGNTFSVVITGTTITFTPPRSAEVVWTYEIDGDDVTLYVDGNEITNLMAGYITVVDGVPTAMGSNGTDYTLTSGGASDDEESEATGLEGTYNMEDADGNAIVVTIDATTISFIPVDATEPVTYGYTYEDGIASFTDSFGVPVTMPMQFYLEVNQGVVISLTYSGVGYNVVA